MKIKETRVVEFCETEFHFDISKVKTIDNNYDLEDDFVKEINSHIEYVDIESIWLCMGVGLFQYKTCYSKTWYTGETGYILGMFLRDTALRDKLEEMFERYYNLALETDHMLALEYNNEEMNKCI